jgi:hypothetical protein
VPLIALVALWGFLAASTLGDAFTERSENQLVSGATLSTYVLLGTIEQERVQAFLWLSSPRRPPVSQLDVSRNTTNSAIAAQQGTNSFQELGEKQDVLAALREIPGIRSAIDAGKLSPAAAFQAYSGVVDKLFTVFTTNNQADNTLYQHTLGAIYAGRALEQLSREVAVVTAAQANHGQLSPADVMLFAEAVGNQNLLVGDALAVADPTLRAGLQSLYNSPLHATLASLENQFSTAGRGQVVSPRTLSDWGQVSGAFEAKMTAITTGDAGPLGSEAGQVSNRLFLEAGLAGGLGLLAVLVSVFLMIRFGRTIRRDLTGLQDGAETMASERLPHVIERLRQGDTVDVAAESPPLAIGKITEVARVAEAFSAVQRTAVDAAVSQSNLRKAINKVFLNLSLRNQSLLHRQLGMLDTMERATNDPGAGRAVPAGPPDHPHAPPRGEPDHPVRGHARAPLARPRAGTGCPQRGHRRGGGLRPGGRGQGVPALGSGHRRERRGPPDRRAGGERHVLLAAEQPRGGQGGRGRLRRRGGDRGPRSRHHRRGTGGDQRPAGQAARVRPDRKRPARPVRGRPARRTARDQGLAA